MAIVTPRSASELLTYEQYMAEGEIENRYDIVDGVRSFMPSSSWRHQRIADKITRLLLAYEEMSGVGLALSAPFDVLIRRDPLRTRQPDVLFVTQARLGTGGGIPESGPIDVAPELVVEIISDSESERTIGDKIADYVTIGVSEAWIVRPVQRTVEILSLTPPGSVPVATYRETHILQSVALPGLAAAVVELFK
jgi:Uma2 family endonuclease